MSGGSSLGLRGGHLTLLTQYILHNSLDVRHDVKHLSGTDGNGALSTRDSSFPEISMILKTTSSSPIAAISLLPPSFGEHYAATAGVENRR